MNITKNNLSFSFMEEQDLKVVSSILMKDSVCYYTSFGPNTKEETVDYLLPIIQHIKASLSEGKNPDRIAITIRKNSTIIGHCGLEKIDVSLDNYILGYFLNEDQWAKGYGTTVISVLLDYAFNTLNAYKVTGDCFEENIPSKKLMQNIGMQLEGTVRAQYFRHNRYFNQCFLGILRTEYLI